MAINPDGDPLSGIPSWRFPPGGFPIGKRHGMLGSVQFGSVRFGSVRFGPPFRPVWCGSFRAVRFGSAGSACQAGAIAKRFIPFGSRDSGSGRGLPDIYIYIYMYRERLFCCLWSCCLYIAMYAIIFIYIFCVCTTYIYETTNAASCCWGCLRCSGDALCCLHRGRVIAGICVRFAELAV